MASKTLAQKKSGFLENRAPKFKVESLFEIFGEVHAREIFVEGNLHTLHTTHHDGYRTITQTKCPSDDL